MATLHKKHVHYLTAFSVDKHCLFAIKCICHFPSDLPRERKVFAIIMTTDHKMALKQTHIVVSSVAHAQLMVLTNLKRNENELFLLLQANNSTKIFTSCAYRYLAVF